MGKLAAAIAVATALWGGAASAETVIVSMTGTITSQGPGPATDPHIKVGDTLQLTATFDSSTLLNWGDSGYQIAQVYSSSATSDPKPLLTISGPDGVWVGGNNIHDGGDIAFTDDEFYFLPDGSFVSVLTYIHSPVIILQGAHAAGVTGYLNPTLTSTIPNLQLGGFSSGSHTITGGLNGAPIVETNNFPDIHPNPNFEIDPGYGLYGNTTQSQGFSGVWDFADSTVTIDGILAVPEPSTWAIFILGFGIVGGCLRRRQGIAAPAVAPARAIVTTAAGL